MEHFTDKEHLIDKEHFTDNEENLKPHQINPLQTLKPYLNSIFIILVISFFISNAYYINEASQRAVETRFGQLIRITENGLHLKLPFIENYQQYQVDKQAMSLPSVSTASSDNYTLYGKIVLHYRLPEQQVEYVHRNVPNFKNYLKIIVENSLKNEMGKMTMEQVVKKPQLIEQGVLKEIRQKARALLKIEIDNFSIPYYGWGQQFLHVVQKNEENRSALRAAQWDYKYTTEMASREKQKIDKKINNAGKKAEMRRLEAENKAKLDKIMMKAKAEALFSNADIQADAIRIKGEAQAVTFKAQAQAFAKNPNLIELEKIKRWNGKLPKYFLNRGSSPFMSSINKENLLKQLQ